MAPLTAAAGPQQPLRKAVTLSGVLGKPELPLTAAVTPTFSPWILRSGAEGSC